MMRASRAASYVSRRAEVRDGGNGRAITRRLLTAADLTSLRVEAVVMARAAGLGEDRAAHFALAVNEIAANTIVHAAGTGEVTLRWDGHRTVYARITDRGPGIRPETAGHNPQPAATGGRGLWLTRRLIDGFRVDSSPDGTTVHLKMITAPADPGTEDTP
jgi:anti-sigma regulatory factor (Ser/Thr protein kinase)